MENGEPLSRFGFILRSTGLQNVRNWHISDIDAASSNVRFRASFGRQREAPLGPVDHGLRRGHLVVGPGRRCLDIDDDGVLDVDQIVVKLLPKRAIHSRLAAAHPADDLWHRSAIRHFALLIVSLPACCLLI